MVDGNGAPCSGLNFGFFAMLYKVKNGGVVKNLGGLEPRNACIVDIYYIYN